ncbi:MAG: PEP-utilizing enzyme [Patescibacteria group bacterium]
MNIIKLIKIIKSDTWWSEEGPIVPLVSQWMQQFVEQSRYWHPKLPTVIFCFVKKDFGWEETPESQKLKIWNYVLNQYIKRPSIQIKRYQEWRKIFSAIKKEGEWFLKNKSKLTKLELAKSFARIIELIKTHWRYTWVQECADVFSTYHLPKLIKKEKPEYSIERVTDFAIDLVAPTTLSFMEYYRLDLLKLAIKNFKVAKSRQPTTAVKNQLINLADKYIWLLSNYKEGRPLTWQIVWRQIKSDFYKKTLAELKNELNYLLSKPRRAKITQRSLYKKLRLSSRLTKACQLLSWWSRLIDERKHCAQYGNWYIEHYVQEIAKRIRINPWLVKYMLAEEVIEVLVKGKQVNTAELNKRRNLVVFVTTKEKGKVKKYVLTGRPAQILWNQFFKSSLSREIKGQVACAPVDKVIGKAQIVLDVHRDKFTKGNILVTTMTRPEFVPLIRKARAIICDEGGLTRHAAIISRELGIPCIIGTKVASKQLKNGSKIELDLKRGEVKVMV